ncbi:MAG: 23S rRNA (pseudouridine(1915)-N(3))-methyltransferase RlmH, partial [Rhodospirillaceae bacterium]
MKLFLIAVGRAGKGPEQALFDRYATRLRGALQVIEVEEKRPLAALERRNREADLLINALPKGSCWVVAL